MSDPDSSSPFRVTAEAEPYPSESLPATASLRELLHRQISCTGPLRFADFMASALYQPQLGYYARETRQVGRGGDFFTSVSIGPLFGELLARRFLREWQESGSPTHWRIIECGAHDGTLAADILGTLTRLSPQALEGLEYAISEPLSLLQAAQRKTLDRFSEHTRFVSTPGELDSDPRPGIAFGNELLDALPFHLVEWHSDGWRECRVNADPSGDFIWENDHPIDDPKLLSALALLGSHFPTGYRTEVRTNFTDLLAPLTRCLSSGLFLWLDYGFARPEFYDSARKSGTLRTFSKHRAAEDPLATPGEIDITAHVDFTALAETAIQIGCRPVAFSSQGTWLTGQARDWLLAQEGSPDAAGRRQFQTLTHPAHLGGCFHALEISWNQPAAPVTPPETWHRLGITPP
jgi:SAM-dependent MidA family methyltransferase